MKLVTGLTAEPKQRIRIALEDRSKIDLHLEYVPQQLGWFYSLTHGDFALDGARLVSSPNILRQYRGILPFGLAVIAKEQGEPLRQSDLADGTVSIHLLEGADLPAVETTIFTR